MDQTSAASPIVRHTSNGHNAVVDQETGEILPAIPGQMTRTALLLPDGLPFDLWQQVGETLRLIESGVMWWLGAWWNYGQRAYGEMASQAARDAVEDATGRDFQTVNNAGWVDRRIEFSRRRENLSWSHHLEVAALEPDEQEHWLDRAEVDGLSVHRLRAEIKRDRRRAIAVGMGQPRDGETYRLIHAGIDDLAGHVAPGTVDAIITDPPYPAAYLPLYETLARQAANLLRPGGSLVVMTGQSYLPDILTLMTPHLAYRWACAYLTPGGQAVQVWDRTVNTFWKPLLWFVNGEYAGEWIGDVARSAVNDNDKRHHDWGQSESGMADVVERFSRTGDLILDPFAGASTTGVVAVRLGRRYIGADIDADAISISAARLAEVRP